MTHRTVPLDLLVRVRDALEMLVEEFLASGCQCARCNRYRELLADLTAQIEQQSTLAFTYCGCCKERIPAPAKWKLGFQLCDACFSAWKVEGSGVKTTITACHENPRLWDAPVEQQREGQGEPVAWIDVGGIPLMTDYALGWNACRQAMYEANAATPATPQDDGYKEAWYEIAYLLGIGAQNASPKDVHANQVMPRLRALRELEAATPQDSVPAWAMELVAEWRSEILRPTGIMDRTLKSCADELESRALALAQRTD